MSAPWSVWAVRLTDPHVTVHERDHTSRRDAALGWRATKCGRVTARWQIDGRGLGSDYDGRGLGSDYEYLGVDLLTDHARAMGARFCRRCWPDGAE